MRFLKRSEKSYQVYNSIDDLPIDIWFKVHEESNLSLLIISGKAPSSYLLKCWEKMQNEYLAEFGMTEEQEEQFEAKKKAALHRCNYLLTNQRHHLTLARIEDEKAKIKAPIKKTKLTENLALLSKNYGFRMDGRVLTVREYYSYIKMAS